MPFCLDSSLSLDLWIDFSKMSILLRFLGFFFRRFLCYDVFSWHFFHGFLCDFCFTVLFFLFLGFCNSLFVVCAFVFRVSCDFSSTVPFLRLCFATIAAFLLLCFSED